MLERVRHSSIFPLLMATFAFGWALACQLTRPNRREHEMISPPSTRRLAASRLNREDGQSAAKASPPLVTPEPQMTPIWGVVTLIAGSLFLAFLFGFLHRWWLPELPFLIFSANVAQLLSLLSLLGLQVEAGQQFISRFSKRHSFMACLMALLMGLVLLFAPSQLAEWDNQRGGDALEVGNVSLAIHHFRRAAAFAPDNADAHYNLGNSYEGLQDLERAIAEYQEALALNDQHVAAYNNLGRLYLLTDNSDAALTTLLAGQKLATHPLEQAVLRKNIAWAYLEKGRLDTALVELQAAISQLQEQPNVSIYLAESYRLTALLYAKLGDETLAEQAWRNSQGHALAVRDSPICANSVANDCLNAHIWAAEAKDALEANK